VKHLFSAAQGNLADLDPALGDDEEAQAGLALLEQELARAKRARRASSGQATQFGGRQRAKVRGPGERVHVMGRRAGAGHHCAADYNRTQAIGLYVPGSI
jgi:hypothetical protein